MAIITPRMHGFFELCDNNLQHVIYSAFELACLKGHLELAQYIADRFELTIYCSHIAKIFHIICKCGKLDVVKWIIERFKLTTNDLRRAYRKALNGVCNGVYNGFEIIQYLTEQLGFTADDIRKSTTLRTACKCDNLELAQFLINYFGLTKEDVPKIKQSILDRINWELPPLGPKFTATAAN